MLPCLKYFMAFFQRLLRLFCEWRTSIPRIRAQTPDTDRQFPHSRIIIFLAVGSVPNTLCRTSRQQIRSAPQLRHITDYHRPPSSSPLSLHPRFPLYPRRQQRGFNTATTHHLISVPIVPELASFIPMYDPSSKRAAASGQGPIDKIGIESP